MKNRTDIIGISVMDRTKQLAKNYYVILEFAVFALIGFIMANSFIFKNVAPFGVAFCAAAGKEMVIASALGAALGYIFSLNINMTMKYLGALVLAMTLRWVFASAFSGNRRQAFIPLAAFGSVLATSFAVEMFLGMTVYNLIMVISESVLAAGAAYFFAKTLKLYESRDNLIELESADLSCVIITFGIMVIALANFHAGPLSIGRILSVLVTLLCASYAGEMAGAVAGITAGVAMGLVGENYAFLTGAYGVGGLLAGLFSAFGKFGSAAAFIVANAIAVFFAASGKPGAVMYETLYDVFAASVIFMLIPAKAARAVAFFTKKHTRKDSDSLKNLLVSKMSFASSALEDIANTTQKVTDKLSAMSCDDDVASVYARTVQKVCGRCGLNMFCWQTAFNETMNSLGEVHTLLKKEGEITKANIPRHFHSKCCKMDQLLDAAKADFTAYQTKQGAQRMVSQVRSVVTDQFDGMAILLKDMAEELGEISQGDRKLTAKIRELFNANHLDVRTVSCFEDVNGRMIAEVTIPAYKLNRTKTIDLTVSMCELCDRDFEKPIVTSTEKECRLRFVERATYTVDMASSQIGMKNAKICGDTCESFVDQNMKAILMISDGMGSGASAAVDSAMATGLLSRFISAGIGFTAALKMVNSAMLVKSGEESLATVDITCIDLYTGKTEFLKAGAAPTFVRKSGRVGSVESTSLPAGILRGVSFETTSVVLSEGDWVVMVSDGVLLNGSDWVTSELAHYEGKDPKQLSEMLVNTAKARMIDGHEDDITVVAAYIKKGV